MKPENNHNETHLHRARKPRFIEGQQEKRSAQFNDEECLWCEKRCRKIFDGRCHNCERERRLLEKENQNEDTKHTSTEAHLGESA